MPQGGVFCLTFEKVYPISKGLDRFNVDLIHFDDFMRVWHPMRGGHLALMIHERACEVPSDSLRYLCALPTACTRVCYPVNDICSSLSEPERVRRS